ncbi:unnamed protein product [Mytilus coruscus]|uniref:Uncharacterized protein n=1 Tax=Mytilus coruscus TaxID=42192 RepID=A0A6J8EPY9_MYTCO|nr:unnamed protein product [Mytilus coruscus]
MILPKAIQIGSKNAIPNIHVTDLIAHAWTNVFREEIEVERKLGERTAILKFCLSATISDKGEHVFEKRRHNCSTKLEWFVCKNVSTTGENTYYTDVVTDSKYGVMIGGVLGTCSMITVLAVLIVCKVRAKEIFTESNTYHYEDTSRVNISTTIYEDLENTKHKSATATSNQTCVINESIAPVYDEVNKIEKPGKNASK